MSTMHQWVMCVGLIACGTPGSPASSDAGSDAPPSVVDAAPDTPGPVDETATWARYSIAVGAHSATVTNGAAGNPRAGFITGVGTRGFDLVLDPSAIYVLTNPTQPEDQLDWNKLPGVSD